MQSKLPIIAIDGIIGAQLSPLDRGLAYGDGVFETCKLQGAVIPLWKYHRDRLLNSCQQLGIPLLMAVVEAQLSEIIAASAVSEAVIKITVTRGQGGRGYKSPSPVQPTVIIGVFPAAEHPPLNALDGVSVHLCKLRLSQNPALAGIKHLNRLEQVLARAEWTEDGIAEGLLFDSQNALIEGVFSNIFLVRDGALLTPDLSVAGVAGVMRRHILEDLAPACAIPAQITHLDMDDLCGADEIFLCNSLYGIWPVREVLTSSWAAVSPGRITRRLQDAYAQNLIN